MRKYVGVDYGVKKVAFGVLHPRKGVQHPEVFSCFWNKKRDADDVLWELPSVIADNAALFKDATMVSIEYPFMAKNAKTAVRMAMVAGTLFSHIGPYAPDAVIHFVPPATWKRDVIGYARADKEQTIKHMEGLYPEVVLNNDDEADALAMAHWGWKVDPDV